jgi:hypothetical protein
MGLEGRVSLNGFTTIDYPGAVQTQLLEGRQVLSMVSLALRKSTQFVSPTAGQ